MDAKSTDYFLLTDGLPDAEGGGHWRFVLSSNESGETLSAGDREPESDDGRLALLALVRGLEAIEQPARVTLVTSNRYVRNGLERGLRSWKSNDWKWERFGRLVTIRDHDLWRRVDRALQIHRVECRSWRLGVTESTSCVAPEDPQEMPESPRSACYEPRATSDFAQEPALLVIRKPRNRLRLDPAHTSPTTTHRPRHAAAC